MLKAADIMTKEVVTILSSATVAEAMNVMKEGGWRSLIVDRDDEQDAYGIITETDITHKVTAAHREPELVQVCEIMTKPCIVVNPGLSVENVAKLFVNNHLLRAPVIQGQLLGIISISDILMKSNVAKQLDKAFPGQNLHEAVQQARTMDMTDAHPPEPEAMAWDAVEEKLAQLLQQHGEKVLETALEEYFKEFDCPEDPAVLNSSYRG